MGTWASKLTFASDPLTNVGHFKTQFSHRKYEYFARKLLIKFLKIGFRKFGRKLEIAPKTTQLIMVQNVGISV